MSAHTARRFNTADVTAVIDEVDDILTIIGGCAVLMEAEMTAGHPNARDLQMINTLVIRGAEVTKKLREVTGGLRYNTNGAALQRA